ncbi:hypothetical protein YC2023_012007 [Brassica napus]
MSAAHEMSYVSREDAHGQGERQARGRRERSTSPLDRSHKSRPSQDRATTASRNDEGSNARGSGAEPNDEVGSIARIRAAEEVLAANKKLSIDFRFPLSF